MVQTAGFRPGASIERLRYRLGGRDRRLRRHAAHAPTDHYRRRAAMRPRVPVAACGVRKRRREPVPQGVWASRHGGVEHRPPRSATM